MQMYYDWFNMEVTDYHGPYSCANGREVIDATSTTYNNNLRKSKTPSDKSVV